MKNVIKIFAASIIALVISSISGCADFPDEYAVDASIGDISLKDDAKLSEDGKNYSSAILVNIDIKENTFKEINSAIVTIDGTEYDVKDQINPTVGGKVEIPCTLECNKTITVKAELKIANHSFDCENSISSYNFTDQIKCATGNAEKITPCSANLYVDVKYPWLVKNYDYYMLIDKEAFNLSVNSGTDTFKGKIIKCAVSSANIQCQVSGLDANTTYYYQLVRLDSNSRVLFSGETKTFSTPEATAKLTTSISNIKLTSAKGNVSFVPGNLTGLYTTYDKSKINDARILWYVGKSVEELNSASGAMLGGGFEQITYPFTFDFLDASTKYYYRCDLYIGEGLMCSSGVHEFTTTESTASLDITNTNVFDTRAEIGTTLNKGNTTSVISSSGFYYATAKLFCGTSKDNMTEKETISAYSSNTFKFYLKDLTPNKHYYYKVCYYAGDCLLGSSDIKEFTTYKSSDITNIGSLDISTSTNYSSNSKKITITARKGSILAFDYHINQGGHSLKVQLTGPTNETILNAASSRTDWESGSIYHVFTEAGTYTLTLSYSAQYYGSISIPEILLIY